jgi:hypothetical protein
MFRSYYYLHRKIRCIYFHLKMLVRPKHVANNLNKIVNNYRPYLTLPPSVSRKSRQCEILNISQSYMHPRPVMGITLLYWRHCVQLERWLVDECRSEMDLAGSSRCLTGILPRHFLGGTEEYHKIVSNIAVQAKIKTGHVPHTNQKQCCLN